MKLSTRSRYGLRMMFELALNSDRDRMLLREIATKQQISEKYLSQIVIPLKRAGLVHAIRGAYGGYMLAKPAEAITVKEIVDVLEGDLFGIDCLKEDCNCTLVERCVTKNVWAGLGNSLSTFLSSIQLSHLVDDYHANFAQQES